MQKWKEKQGSETTYRKLIKIFERAGYELYADDVRSIMSKCSDQADKPDDSADQQNFRPPSSQTPLPQLPEFPESVTLTASTVQLEKHHQESKYAIISLYIIINYIIFIYSSKRQKCCPCQSRSSTTDVTQQKFCGRRGL